MKKIFGCLALTIFGTLILLYSVIAHEPPAFIAYAFGLINGLCWAGIVGLIWIRQYEQENHDD
ncbi:MAG: hypothetical protein IKN27_07180 [Selenomonadaceae bacterium]|nr:hypothetical protein [Selenomonadaceae bacterium]